MRQNANQRVGKYGDGGQNVFAVVQHQNDFFCLQAFEEGLLRRPARFLLRFEDLRHCLRHKGGVGQRGEFHEPNAVGRMFQQIGGGLQSKARFAAAARPNQRDEPGILQKANDFRAFLFASNQGGELLRQVVGIGGVIQRFQRREIGRKFRMQKLKTRSGRARSRSRISPKSRSAACFGR